MTAYFSWRGMCNIISIFFIDTYAMSSILLLFLIEKHTEFNSF